MTPTPRVLAIVQAGGKGSRMDVLTRERAKPGLPFGGHYQLVDFALSSIANSGITDVWLSVQYQAQSLARHVAGGRPWDLDRTRGGLRWLMPEEGAGAETQSGFSAGNADDLYRTRDEIEGLAPDLVVVTSTDSVFTLDLREVVARHLERAAHATVVTTEVTRTQAKAKAVVTTRRDGLVTRVAYKPKDPSGTTVAAEVFVYDTAVLLETLERLRRDRASDATDGATGLGDFGETLLPELVRGRRVYAHPLSGYWRDLGTPSDYLAAHRDLLAGRVDVLTRDDWPILSRFPELPAARVRQGAVVEDSVVSAGCDIAGTVRRSVLGPGVVVGAGARVEDSVVFARTTVEAGARVSTSIVDARVRVGRGARVGKLARATRPRDGAIVIVGKQSVIAAGAEVAAGARLEPGTTA